MLMRFLRHARWAVPFAAGIALLLCGGPAGVAWAVIVAGVVLAAATLGQRPNELR
jgi:hypothetical protein